MTRETKLALVVGFALVLVVGILVTDHFSTARKSQPGTGLAVLGPNSAGSEEGVRYPLGVELAEVDRYSGGMGGAMPDPAGTRFEDVRVAGGYQGTIYLPPEGSGGAAGATGGTLGGASASGDAPRPEWNAVEGTRGEERDERGNLIASGLVEPVEHAQRPGVGGANGGGRLDLMVDPRLVNYEKQVIGDGSGQENGLGVGAGDRARVGEEETSLRLPVSSGKVERRSVKEGETLYQICQEKYGDGNVWAKLKEYNAGKIGGNGAVRAGVTLVFPPRDVMSGKAVLAGQGGQRGSGGAGRVQEEASGASGGGREETGVKKGSGKTYTIQKGDVLSVVAQKTLGSAKRMQELIDANPDVIDDPDNVAVGTVLKIPGR